MHKFAKELMGVVACILAVYGGSTMGFGMGGWGHGGPDFSWPAILMKQR